MSKSKILYTIAVILVLVFCVKTGLDRYTYITTLNSAPFRYWVLVNGIYFLLPAAIAAAIAWVTGKKND